MTALLHNNKTGLLARDKRRDRSRRKRHDWSCQLSAARLRGS